MLRCADVERTLAWYTDVLGLDPVRLDEWRRGDAPFPSVRINDGTIIDLVAGEPIDGRLDHFCVVIEPTDLAVVAASGAFDVLDGPDTRYGARAATAPRSTCAIPTAPSSNSATTELPGPTIPVCVGISEDRTSIFPTQTPSQGAGIEPVRSAREMATGGSP